MVVALEVVLGAGALAGGLALLLAPDGHILGLTPALLAGSPFHDYLIPGLVLFTVLGVFPVVAAVLTARGSPVARPLAIAVGVLLVGWIAIEMLVMAGPASLLWSLYLVLGCAIAALGLLSPR